MAGTKRRKRRPGLKADYRGATPEQVARRLHGYRPTKQEKAEASSVSGGGRRAE